MTPLRIESKGTLSDGKKAKGLLIKIVQDCEAMNVDVGDWKGVVINDDGDFEVVPLDSIRCIDPDVVYDMRTVQVYPAPINQLAAYKST